MSVIFAPRRTPKETSSKMCFWAPYSYDTSSNRTIVSAAIPRSYRIWLQSTRKSPLARSFLSKTISSFCLCSSSVSSPLSCCSFLLPYANVCVDLNNQHTVPCPIADPALRRGGGGGHLPISSHYA